MDSGSATCNDAAETGAQLLLTVSEAARFLSIGRSSIYVLMRDGALPSVKVGRSRRVRTSDLRDYVRLLRVTVTAELMRDRPGSPTVVNNGRTGRRD
jgi:excisionase family DNA binding protein